MGSIDGRREGALTSMGVRGEVLSFLFDGPAGAMHLGRRGGDGHVVLLRAVAQNDLPGVCEVLKQAIALRDVAVSPVYGLLETGSETYIASQYIDGLALNEFLRVAASSRWFGEVLRILHDALLIAERLDARRAADELGPSRYLFADTIWVTLQGKVVISEPVIAAHLRHVTPTSQTFKRQVSGSSERAASSDVEEVVAMLASWHAGHVGASHATDSAEALFGGTTEGASRHDLARLLADLSEQPVAAPAQVAAAVQRLAGTELVRRRLMSAQSPRAAQLQEGETAPARGGPSAPRPAPGAPPPPSPANLQRGGGPRLGSRALDGAPSSRPGFGQGSPKAPLPNAAGESPMPRATASPAARWTAGAILDPSALDEDDDITAAFRPSQLPKLLAGSEADVFDRPTATPPEPQSFQSKPTDAALEPPPAAALRPPRPAGFESPSEPDAARDEAPAGAAALRPPRPAGFRARNEPEGAMSESDDVAAESHQLEVLDLKVRRTPAGEVAGASVDDAEARGFGSAAPPVAALDGPGAVPDVVLRDPEVALEDGGAALAAAESALGDAGAPAPAEDRGKPAAGGDAQADEEPREALLVNELAADPPAAAGSLATASPAGMEAPDTGERADAVVEFQQARRQRMRAFWLIAAVLLAAVVALLWVLR